jgi:hypothetical protein
MKKYIFIISLFFLNSSLAWSQTKSGVSTYSSKFFPKNLTTQQAVPNNTLIINGLEIDSLFFKKFEFPLFDREGRDLKIESFFFDENIFNSPTLKVYSDPIDNILIYKPELISPIPTYKPDSTINFTIIIKDFK